MSDKKEVKSEFEADVAFEKKTNSQIAEELARWELEEKQLDLEIKRETVSKIRAQRQARLDETRSKTIATLQFLAQRKANQDLCLHTKGGIGADAVMRGQGTSAMYCIIKHKLPSGRWYCCCQRCLKEWFQGHELLGIPETPGFQQAIKWPTDNSPSQSSTFLFEKTAV